MRCREGVVGHVRAASPNFERHVAARVVEGYVSSHKKFPSALALRLDWCWRMKWEGGGGCGVGCNNMAVRRLLSPVAVRARLGRRLSSRRLALEGQSLWRGSNEEPDITMT